MFTEHVSVLAKEVAEWLDNLQEGGICVDCTLGGGGHSLEILKRYPKVEIIGFDRDEIALEIAKEKLRNFKDRVSFFHENFSDFAEILSHKGISKVEAVIADVGMSSFQLDNKERGFSFEKNGPLDMRMGLNEKSAYEVINNYPVEKLANIIYVYGEERFSRRIARVIGERRPLKTTFELRDAIISAIPVKLRNKWKKNVMRVFQAIRIEVNGELDNLNKMLDSSKKRLRSGGRIAVISFHSLEDRIVKRKFKEEEFIALTKKPVLPSEEEKRINPRAKSAKLRVAERA
ncbi:16S rRNA (cytosine(1402)-N(4))-methyltransferase RsmH [Mesoaciditoga sp.]